MPYDNDPPVIAPAHLLHPSIAGCGPRSSRSSAGNWFTDPGNLWARIAIDVFTLGTAELVNLAMDKDAKPSYTSMLQDQSDDPNAPSPDDAEVAPTDSPAGTNATPSLTDAAAAQPDAGADTGVQDLSTGVPDDGSMNSSGAAKKPRSHNTPAHHQARSAVKDALKKQAPGQDKAYGQGWKAGKRGDSPAQVASAVAPMSKVLARSYRHAWKTASGRIAHKMPNFGPHPGVTVTGFGQRIMPVMY